MGITSLEIDCDDAKRTAIRLINQVNKRTFSKIMKEILLY